MRGLAARVVRQRATAGKLTAGSYPSYQGYGVDRMRAMISALSGMSVRT